MFENIDNYNEVVELYGLDTEVLSKVLKVIGETNYIDVKESNGSSFVVLPIKYHELNNRAYQYFKNNDISKRIFLLFGYIHRHKNIVASVFSTKEVEHSTFYFNLTEYLAEIISYVPRNIIIWEQHFCLNSISEDERSEFIIKNLPKFLWDIGKAIHGLHSCNILHGDCRIDNMGIRNGNFILFDFDNTFVCNTGFQKDFYDFRKSIEFNLGKILWVQYMDRIPQSLHSMFFINELLNLYNLTVSEINNVHIIYN